MYIELIEELDVPFLTSPSSYIDNDLKESDNFDIKDNQLIVSSEALHSIITGNYTFYEPSCIAESLPYWTDPYKIPIIYNHKDQDSKIIGRVQKAFFIKNSNRTGTPALGLILGIGDKEGKEGVLNETLLSLSIGAKATDLRCSICGKNLVEHGFCEHEKGKKYDGKLCYWIVKKMIPREVSYVTVPSDRYAYSEKPINKYQNLSVSESLKNDEVKEMHDTKNSIFSDCYAEMLAEQQEKNLTEGEPAVEETPKNKEEKQEEQPTAKETPKEEIKEVPKDKEEPKKEIKEPKAEKEEKTEKNNVEDFLQRKIQKLEAELETLKKLYKESEELRESAEQKCILLESTQKQELSYKINELRTSLGLQEKDNTLLMKTDIQILQNEVNTLNEYSNSTIARLKEMKQISNPSVVDEENDNTIKEVSLKEQEDNINLNTALRFNNFIKRK